jgi:GNAT superfamily N-acetyltransferase
VTDIQIRPVSAEDHGAWLPLWQAYLQFYKTQLPDSVSASTWQRLLDESEPNHAALAWKEGKAVGMVHFIYHRSNWSIANSCYLQDLLVTPQERGTGVGRLLIEYVCATAKANGCDKVHWLTHEPTPPRSSCTNGSLNALV